MELRKKHVLQTIDSVLQKDWERIAQLAELDTIYLHSVTMSGSKDKKPKIIAWEPETIEIIRSVNEMRNLGIPVYYSIDTGPSPVLITHKRFANEIKSVLTEKGYYFIEGKIAGEAKVIDLDPNELM
jgi:diphosphomevalonate decarboxylase